METKTKTKKSKKKVTFNIVPNIERVIIRLIKTTDAMSPVAVPGQLKAGEGLHTGEVIHPGFPWVDGEGKTHKPKFEKGQVVYYSEYSAAKLSNVGSMLRGEQTLGGVLRESDIHVVAADDVMAYEKEVFDFDKPDELDSPEESVIEKP